MGCFSAGAAIGGVIGGAMNSGGAANAAGASLEAIELSTRVARSLHDHWKNYYKQCDADAISEVCAIPLYVAPAATIAGRQRLEVIRTVGRKRQQLYRGQNVYHVGKMAQDCNVIAALEASAALDASEWGYRRGQNLEIQRNQKRLENIYAYLGLGRNLLSNALGAASIAGAIAAQLGAEQGKNIAGWSQFLGVLQTKEGQAAIKGVFGGIERMQVESAAREGYVSDAEAAAAGGTPFTNPSMPAGSSDSVPLESPSSPAPSGAWGDQPASPVATSAGET